MDTIMLVLVGAFVACAVAMAAVFIGGRLMFRIGLRNLRRRRAQSVLVIVGLMLATVMISAAFTTGDTVDYSVTRVTYDFLQRTDLSLHHFQTTDEASGESRSYATDDIAARLTDAFGDDEHIEGFIPFLFETVPVLNEDSSLAEPDVVLAGIDAESMSAFGGIRLSNGESADLTSLGPLEVFANTRAADRMDIEPGDRLTLYMEGRATTVTVAGIVREERATGGLEFGGGEIPGIAAPLASVQAMTGREGLVNSVSVVLRGGVEQGAAYSDEAAARIESFVATAEGKQALGLGDGSFQVETIKQDALDDARLAASAFTTVFLVLGLFSIASGVLLIFMIFVMLAAERRREMGIARAVGARRIHLVQAFLAEGMVYALVAGVLGVGLGVAFGLTVITAGSKLAFGDDLAFITAYVSLRTLIVSFCLGSVMTFVTVAGSSIAVSQLNIVAAIRGQVAPATTSTRRAFSLSWLAASIPVCALIPPVGIYLLLRKGLGLSRAWAFTPLALALAVILVPLGRVIDSSFLFSLGISLLVVGAAVLVRKWGAPERITWTLAGVGLATYWLMPLDVSARIFGDFASTGMEMFVLSGIMIVTALTLIIVFNARALTAIYGGAARGRRGYVVPLLILAAAATLVLAGRAVGNGAGGIADIGYLFAIVLVVAGGFSLVAQSMPHLAPALRMGIAYPLASRFRTGMTIAMFSLILFSMTVMSVINASFLRVFAGDEGTGGWDIYVGSNRNNPIDDLGATMQEAGIDASRITGIGALTVVDDDRQKVRQAGKQDWEQFIVRAANDDYFDTVETRLEARATGYATDAEVYRAVKEQDALGIIEAGPLVAQTFDAASFRIDGVTIEDDQFEPFVLQVRNEATGDFLSVTVVGIFTSRLPPGLFPGLIINGEANTALFGSTNYRDFLVRTEPGTDSNALAEAIEAGLVTKGVQAISIEKEIDDALAASRGFLRVMQLFMGLGLIVGIAAIGVISLRSVVERRQQIGMLRAIGFERRTIALGFLFESAFIALMGAGSGVIGAVILSRNLLSVPEFTGTEGLTFFVPWVEIITFTAVAFAFAIMMTWWPSRIAADVPVAEALRYE